jgi:thymidylate kinase
MRSGIAEGMMFTVALVGGDGAGKATVTRWLEQSLPMPAKYMYMGFSTQSSNHALPSSRLVLFLKRHSYRRAVRKKGATPPRHIPSRELEYSQRKQGTLWVAVRNVNRLAEAWYRQLVSLNSQFRGYIIVYDRHVLFDSAPGVVDSHVQKQGWADGLQYWILNHMYPKPDLAILLDAPPEVLYARKGEAMPDRLERQRAAYLEQGRKLNSFVRVDATQPIDRVLEDVTQHIVQFHASRHLKKLEGDA